MRLDLWESVHNPEPFRLVLEKRAMNKTVLGLLAVLPLTCSSLALAATKTGLSLISEVEGIALVELGELPAAPADQGDVDLCSHLVMTPATQGGRLAESNGWFVTWEEVISSYDVVSFVGGFGPGTSGSCELLDGNIGIFEAGELIALAYSADTSAISIGAIEALEAGGVRIWDGDYLPYPVADLHIGDGTIEITPLAEIDRVCGGAAEVPSIHGMPIGEARTLLEDHGWSAVAGDELDEFDRRAADYRAEGLIEVASCSGTGFGYCAFLYASDAGMLHVTTVSDPEPPQTPSISSYGVDCR